MTTFRERGERARVLGVDYPASAEILNFYAGVADWQHETAPTVSGFEDLTRALPSLVDLVGRTGPPALAETGSRISPTEMDSLIREHWEAVTDCSTREFFTRALLEIHASNLPDGLDCPWCLQPPQVGCLKIQGDGQALDLVCALCFGRRSFPRSHCPACDESREGKLVAYSTGDFAHLRMRACDSCQGYFLLVDLEKDIRAIPEVDELAALPLDLWAEEHDYHKFQPNIAGI